MGDIRLRNLPFSFIVVTIRSIPSGKYMVSFVSQRTWKIEYNIKFKFKGPSLP